MDKQKKPYVDYFQSAHGFFFAKQFYKLLQESKT